MQLLCCISVRPAVSPVCKFIVSLLKCVCVCWIQLWLCVPAGAVVQTLTNSSITPLTIFAFTFSIPYLQDSPDLGPQFVLGSAILVAGLFTYNSPKWRPWLAEKLDK